MSRSQKLWLGLPLIAIWAPLIYRLTPGWKLDPELMHGWAVPLLAWYLAYERWAGQSRQSASPAIAPTGSKTALGCGLLILALCLPVLEANPFWPLLLWISNTGAIIASLGIIMLASGPRLTRASIIPLAFTYTALPWPSSVQSALAFQLSTYNAQIAAELVSYFGHAAVVTGRIIELSKGIIGIDEACSGMRSLQTVTMVAWFMAALFRLQWKRTVGLFLGAWALAIIGNFIRTGYLIWTLVQTDMATMNERHDTAGELTLIITLASVGLFAWILSRGSPRAQTKATVPSARSASESPLLPRYALITLIVMGTAEIGTQIWYLQGEVQSDRNNWTFSVPPGWEKATVSPRAKELLAYSHLEGRAQPKDPRGYIRLAYLIHWSGDVKNMGAGLQHDPTICLPGLGSRLDENLGVQTITTPVGSLAFNWYRFITPGGKTQHVFFQVFDGYTAQPLHVGDVSGSLQNYRTELVLSGQREINNYQLIFVLEGAKTNADALLETRKTIAQLLRHQS